MEGWYSPGTSLLPRYSLFHWLTFQATFSAFRVIKTQICIYLLCVFQYEYKGLQMELFMIGGGYCDWLSSMHDPVCVAYTICPFGTNI